MPDFDEDYLESAATGPAEAAGDGGSMKAHPIPDLIQALDRKAAVDAMAGSNDQGGPKSAWGALRPARARFRDPT